MFPARDSLSVPKMADPYAFVLAEDTDPVPFDGSEVPAPIEDLLGIPGIHVHGNHYFYGPQLPNDVGDVVTIQDLRFAAALLWTYFAVNPTREASRFPNSSRSRCDS
jgi:hypothetical protein